MTGCYRRSPEKAAGAAMRMSLRLADSDWGPP